MNAMMNNTEALAGGYLAMAQLFSYPDDASWQKLTRHGLVGPGLTREKLETEYLDAFETGNDGSPVPLFEGLNRRELGREGILEDLLRFYEFFDAKLSESDREYPDHLTTELEFLAWLCMKEHAARQEGGDAEPYRHAARDFLDRHTGAWVSGFREKLEATGTVYGEFSATLDELVRQHRALLEEQQDESEA